MALDAKFNAFKVKYSLGDEAMAEMLSIFNDSFIELAHKLLSSNDIEVPKKKQETQSKSKTSSGAKKFATKIAAEYAAENDLTLDDFDKEKITKKDIDGYIKANKSSKPSKTIPKLDTTLVVKETKEPVSKEKCCGITKSGEPCNRPGTEKPDGSSKCFCFRHAMDWKMYEISSDSDLEEEEPHSEEIFRDLAITTEE
tara:strand:+ start:10911 stop:11504 length:594 start_codon:yes stop_codon:yes gene_type:complete